jgi:hypothetical protein
MLNNLPASTLLVPSKPPAFGGREAKLEKVNSLRQQI